MLLAACSGHEQPPSEPDPTEATRVTTPEAAPPTPEFVAVVASRTSRAVSPEFDGNIEKLLVRSGQVVKAGDPIAMLDASQLQSDLERQLSERASAQSEAASYGVRAGQARRQANLTHRLLRTGTESLEAYRTAQAEANAAGAQGGIAVGRIKGANVQIERLQKLIASAKVTAPIDGVISVVKAKVGEGAHKGVPLASVVDPTALLVRFAVPRMQRAKIAQNTVVELRVPGDERPVYATVERVTDELDPTIDFVTVDADIVDLKLHRDVRVGTVGRVRIADKQPAGGS